MNIEPELLTTEEAAATLKLAPGTLASWRSRGRGPAAVYLGGAVRYLLADILAFVEQGRQRPGRAA
jgi:hypothetical protein